MNKRKTDLAPIRYIASLAYKKAIDKAPFAKDIRNMSNEEFEKVFPRKNRAKPAESLE